MSDLDIITTIFREFPYALWGSVVAGMLCAYLGVFVVSKRIVFVGATLTQIAVAGIAFSYLPFIDIDPLYGSVLFTLITVAFFAQQHRQKNVPRDSLLGVSFVVAIALRILMIQKSPAAEVAEIQSILKGDLLFITSEQFFLLLVVSVFVMLVHLGFKKELIFVSVDSETAATQGLRGYRWELLFFLTVGLAISVAISIVGDVFVFGFLVLPALCGLMLAKKVSHVFLLAAAFGMIPPIVGIYLAFRLDFPVGPTSVATAFVALLVSFLIKRSRS